MTPMHTWLARLGWAAATLIALPAAADVGLATIPATETDGPVTVYYPTDEPPQPVLRGPFELPVRVDASPRNGNGRLVVLSHGSGGSPWVHSDLAIALVDAGFVVAMPEHRGDNYRDRSRPGPESWKQRPAEVSRAIDAIAADPRFGPRLDTTRVGVWGMSAGGHTALSLAGGRWSPAGFKRHCDQHIADDFPACVGLATQLRGNWLDGVKKTIALAVLGAVFDDDTAQVHHDPRIAAVVSGVPLAADFDMASLAQPRVPLAIISVGRDAWLAPRFHSDRVLAACRTCDHLADLPTAGHGALLSPPPPGLTGLVAELLDDPPGFDRSVLREVDRKVVRWFEGHLLDADPAPTARAGEGSVQRGSL